MRGDDVLMMQQQLSISGYTGVGTPDGIFGPATQEAVIKFQEDHGLDADGVVGQKTWAALFGSGVLGTPTTIAGTGFAIEQTITLKSPVYGLTSDGRHVYVQSYGWYEFDGQKLLMNKSISFESSLYTPCFDNERWWGIGFYTWGSGPGGPASPGPDDIDGVYVFRTNDKGKFVRHWYLGNLDEADPSAVACTGEMIWVGNLDGKVFGFNRDAQIYSPIPTRIYKITPSYIVTALVANKFLWVSDEKAIYQLDPGNGAIIKTVPYFGQFMAFDGERVWWVERDSRVLRGISVYTYEVTDAIALADEPNGLAFDGQKLWIGLENDSLVAVPIR
jgi:hypothetical protein